MNIVVTTAVVLALAAVSAQAAEVDPLYSDEDLEPCMDGGVSASGAYPSQEAEDRALAAKAAEPEWIGSGSDDVIAAFGGRRDDFNR